MFVHHPLRGEGSGSFGIEWLARRKIPEAALDAHSLYIETAAELGLVGLAALALFLGGGGCGGPTCLRRDAALTAGWIAALSVWLVHAGLDWDWEMPALSLIAMVLAGALIAHAERPARVSAGRGGTSVRKRATAAADSAGSELRVATESCAQAIALRGSSRTTLPQHRRGLPVPPEEDEDRGLLHVGARVGVVLPRSLELAQRARRSEPA